MDFEAPPYKHKVLILYNLQNGHETVEICLVSSLVGAITNVWRIENNNQEILCQTQLYVVISPTTNKLESCRLPWDASYAHVSWAPGSLNAQ